MVEALIPAAAIESNLAGAVYPLAASVAERFGVDLSPDFVQARSSGSAPAGFRRGAFWPGSLKGGEPK